MTGLDKAAPERIWLSAADGDNEREVWTDADEGGTEYIRADLSAASLSRPVEGSQPAEAAVAWRYRPKGSKYWSFVASPWPEDWGDNYDREPLYASPTPAAAGEPVEIKAVDLPWREKDIRRGLILFRTSNNAHGHTNVEILSAKVDLLPQAAKDELARMMMNIAAELSPALVATSHAKAGERGQPRWKIPARELSDDDLVAEFNDAQRKFSDRGEHGGSPGEFWFERMGEIETEQARRAKAKEG